MNRPLYDELSMKRPFESLEQEAFLNLLRTASELGHQMTGLLKGYGLSSTQFNLLRILRGAGEEGAACSQIAERMVTRDPDVTRLLDRLEAMELIRRERSESDRRVVLAFISERGLKVLSELDEPVLRLHASQLGHLGNERLRSFIQLMEMARSPEGG